MNFRRYPLIFLLFLFGLSFSQDDDALTIMGDTVLIVEKVNVCSEIDIEGIAADDSFPDAVVSGDFVYWDRDFNYFLGDSCYWDYTCRPRHTLDGYDTSLQFRFVFWRSGFAYCGVFSPDGDTTSALFLLCNGEIRPVATWGRPFTEDDIYTSAFYTLDYSQNLLAQLLHHQYEKVTDRGYVISGELPILRDRLCHDAPDDSTGVYLYGFNMLSFSLYNNLSKTIWSVSSELRHTYTAGFYSSCWYSGTPIADGPWGVTYFLMNEHWCALCTDSAGLTGGTQSRGFNIHYIFPEHSAIRMQGGSNNLTEAWGYLDGILGMHIINCCTRDYPDANYYVFDAFPDSVRLVNESVDRNISSRFRMAVLADSIYIDDVWEDPTTGIDGNPPPLTLKIQQGWNGYVYPEMSIVPAETLNLGTILIGTSISGNFSISNTGDATMVITSLFHSDSANFSVAYSAYTPPGGTGFIISSFNPTGTGHFEDVLTVYTNVPCNSIVYLYVIAEVIDVTPLIPEIVEPLPNTWTSCSDQQIVMNVLCQESTSTEMESLRVNSSPLTTEYYDSSSSSWVSAESVWSSAWGTHILDGTDWLWDDHYDYGECVDFRVILNLPEGVSPDSASITIYADNQATVYVDGNYIDTTESIPWYHLKTFDISPYLHGGEDTVLIHACDLSGVIAGVDFYIVVFYTRICCRSVDSGSAVMTINGVEHNASDGTISIQDDTLIVYTPLSPDTFTDGDTVDVCLTDAADTCGQTFDELPLCWSFWVDLTPPDVWNIVPAPDAIIEDDFPHISLCLLDSLSGLDTATIGMTVNGGNVEPIVSVNDSCVSIDWDFAEALHFGDTILFCISATDTTDYCDDNLLDTCFTFYIYSQGPISVVTSPYDSIVSGCIDEEIWISLSDTQGIDSTTIMLSIDGDTFTCADSQLTFIDDSLLIFSPDAGYWSAQDTVHIKLLAANDMLGAPLQNQAEFTMFTDFVPPNGSLIEPTMNDWVQDMLAPLIFTFNDAISPILIDSCYVQVDDIVYPMSEILTSLSDDSTSGECAIYPQRYNFHWNPGDTIDITLHICDRPDTCEPNCTDTLFNVRFEPTIACFVHPDPFTPNGDGTNDYTVFDYPRMFVKSAKLRIFDLRNELVAEKTLGPISQPSDFDIRSWNGKDNTGKVLQPGLYLYIIFSEDGEVLCEGTVVLVR